MLNDTTKTKKKYDRYSRFYNLLEFPVEKLFFNEWRRELFSNLHGRILEVGVGTGKNLPHYPKNAKVTAIDLSSGMLSKAIKKSKELKNNAALLQMDAQNLSGFKAHSFSYVVCTFVLCSIPDPVKALKEMKRVVKKNGKIIMVEHVLSKHKFIAFLQHIHNPITKALLGFNVNRDTRSNIEKAGLEIVKDEKLAFFDVFRKFTCIK